MVELHILYSKKDEGQHNVHLEKGLGHTGGSTLGKRDKKDSEHCLEDRSGTLGSEEDMDKELVEELPDCKVLGYSVVFVPI